MQILGKSTYVAFFYWYMYYVDSKIPQKVKMQSRFIYCSKNKQVPLESLLFIKDSKCTCSSESRIHTSHYYIHEKCSKNTLEFIYPRQVFLKDSKDKIWMFLQVIFGDFFSSRCTY